DAGFENLRGDKADFGMPRGLLGEMLAAAKADLQPHGREAGGEQRLRIEAARLRQRYCELRQQRLEKPLLPRAQRPSAAAAIQAAAVRLSLGQGFPKPASERAAQLAYKVEPLPGKPAIDAGLAAEMSIGRGRRVDRLVKAEVGADAARRQIHQLVEHATELRLVDHAAGSDIKR